MTFYYAVIGNRDHIKIGGVKRPFWNFLDVQPDGFLSSLTYAPKVIPIAEDMRQRMIWDCGAWSYKNEDIPPIDAASALAKYTEFAPGSSMVIAPDHMLVDGVDHDARRAWNARQAREFLSICPDYYRPMATVHGQTIAERVEHARELADLGYQYIALGGMAARAAKKREMIETVATVRAEIPDVWLHVLGLSSPEYFRAWSDLAVESCDGSSHFKQAFTGGAFFTREGVKLKKHAAARPGEEITAPQCECRACVMLRDDGVDTRTYGSNETNMGRAAHNLNMLMAAQRSITQKTIGLVACCGEKMGRSASAADLYKSPLFRLSRRWAEQHCDEWVILSAKHGAVHPSTLLNPYDKSLKDMTTDERIEWSNKVRRQLPKGARLIGLAGKDYLIGIDCEKPLEGMGIGQRLAWLAANTQTQGVLL